MGKRAQGRGADTSERYAIQNRQTGGEALRRAVGRWVEALEARRLFAAVATDKADYTFGETALITGGEFQAGEMVQLQVLHEAGTEGSNADPQNAPWQVQADAAGNLSATWVVDDPDATGSTYVLTATGLESGLVAQTTFTDSRTINSVTLNGGSSVTVQPGAGITAAVNVTTAAGGGNQNWRSTGWRIATTSPGSVTVVDHANHDGGGTYSETFSITAPTAQGTYNAYFVAYANDSGTGGSAQPSATFTLAGAVKVDAVPTVQSINRANPDPTSAASVAFTVTFSESVTGVDASDFALITTGGVSGASISSVTGSGNTRTVTVNTGTGSGTIGLNLVDDDSITDTDFTANELGGPGPGNGNFTGQVYTKIASPDAAWVSDLSLNSATDHNTVSAFGTPGAAENIALGQSYQADRYENWDPTGNNDAQADIVTYQTASDAGFFYFRFTQRGSVTGTASTVYHLEVDADFDDVGGDARSDYFLVYSPSSSDVGAAWRDASLISEEVFRDHNNLVGGSNLTAPDAGDPDGYSQSVSYANGDVLARLVDGKVEIAVRRSVFGQNSTSDVRSRGSTKQDGNLDKTKLFYHDRNTVSDLASNRIDNTHSADAATWLSTALNAQPTANSQTATTNEDTDVTITLTGDDGDPSVTQNLTFKISGLPTNGTLYQRAGDGSRGAAITTAGTTVTDSMGRVIFAPDANENGAPYATFQFTVTDDGTPSMTSSAATVTVNVTAVNDAPAVAADSPAVTVTEGQTATNTGTYSDIDGGNVTITASVGAVIKTGTTSGTWSWSYATSDGPNQSQTVTITADDGNGGMTTTTFALTVNNVASTIAISGAANVDEGSSYSLTLGMVTDPGADTVGSYIVHWGDGNSDTYTTNGIKTHTYADGPNTYAITVDLVDEDGTHPNRANALSVTVDNVAPMVTAPANQTADEGENKSFNLGSFTDPAGASDQPYLVNVAWGDGSTDTTFSLAAPGSLGTQSHTYADNGNYTVTVTVTEENGTGASGSAMFQALVANVPPTIAISGAANVDEGSAYSLTLGAVTDPGDDTVSSYIVHWGDGDSDTYSSNGIVTHTYDDGDNTYAITVDLVDEDGTFLDAAANDLSVMVDNVAPTLTISGDASVNEGSLYTLNLSSSDPGQDTIDHWTIDWGDGDIQMVTGNPASVTHVYDDDEAGAADDVFAISATATDEDGTFSANTHDVTVTNLAPTATDDSYAVNENSSVMGNVMTDDTGSGADSDPAGANDPLMVTAHTSPVYGTLTIAPDGQFTYNPNGQFEYLAVGETATQTFTYTINDGDGGIDTATVTLTITGVNDGPAIASISNSSPDCGCSSAVAGDAVTLSAAFGDVDSTDMHTAMVDWGDGSPATPAMVSQNPANSPNPSGGSVSGSHVYGQGGIYTITLTVDDGHGGTHTQTTTAVVTGVGLAADGTLYIIGTKYKDQVQISKDGTRLKVVADFLGANNERYFQTADVQRIHVLLCDGDDQVQISNDVLIAAYVDAGRGNDQSQGGGGHDTIYGGDGDDQIQGGTGNNYIDGGAGNDNIQAMGGNNIILGGAGNDVVQGGTGRDLIIGGRGADELIGNDNDDILCAGLTHYDDDPFALQQIMAEWTRTDASFAARVDHLKGTTPGGLNGGYYLNNTTIDDDDALDQIQIRNTLSGGNGNDWFIWTKGEDQVSMSSTENAKDLDTIT